MRTLGYFALILSVLYMLACSGSSNNSGGGTAKAEAGQFGGVQGQPIMFNGLSSDIINGRIYNRSFQVIRARGVEKFLEDSCVPKIRELDPIQFTISGLPTQQGAPNYNYASYQNGRSRRPLGMEFVFDNSGVLSVRVTNMAGQQTSQPIYPVSGQVNENTYTLDDTRQALIIGAFRTNGTPSPEYNRYNLLQRGVGFPRYNGSLNYNQGFNYSSGEQQLGFRSSYQAGQNPLTQNTSVSGSTPQAQMNNAVPGIAAMFDPMEARIRTSGNINPQHIAEMTVDVSTAYYTIQIADPGTSNRNCITNTRSTTERMLIQ